MKPNYKNWMPRGMVLGFAAGFAVSLGLCLLLGYTALIPAGIWRTLVRVLLWAVTAVMCGLTLWSLLMYRAFSYNGRRQLSRQIIEGTAAHVELPEGGMGLDVGCGSGALTIACARRNPRGKMVGMDRWGKEYASFSKKLCQDNARAEGVDNVLFEQGDAVRLRFPDESFDAVTSNYVYHNISGHDRQELLLETLRVLKKGGTFAIHDIMSKDRYGDMEAFAARLRDMGYERVELVDTTRGLFMSPFEARWMALSGSTLLLGKK